MAPRGKYMIGFCSVCGRDVAIKKSNQKVFRHGRDTTGVLCAGTNEYPSMIVDSTGEVTEFAPILVREQPTEVTVDQREERDPVTRRRKQVTTMSVIEPDNGVLFHEYPVYTEAGTVIGRARVEVGRIVMLGHKWAQRTA